MKPTRRNLLKRILCLPAAVALGASVKSEEVKADKLVANMTVNINGLIDEKELERQWLQMAVKARREGRII